MHQGGLLPALHHIHDSSVFSSDMVPIGIDMNKKFLISYHTYMPPAYLLMPMSKSEFKQRIQTTVIDLKGAKYEELDIAINGLLNKYSMSHIQIFVVLPSILQTDLNRLKQQKYSFNLVKQFGPHLDLDHDFDKLFYIIYQEGIYQWIHTLWNKYNVGLYQVTRD